MQLPIKELLTGSRYQKELESLLNKANLAFLSWQSLWSDFVDEPLQEEISSKLQGLNDIHCYLDGGYPSAERKRICFTRCSEYKPSNIEPAAIKALNIEGNFLFDRASKKDFIQAIKELDVSTNELGDLWIIRDRGAQILCKPETSLKLNGKKSLIRDVEIYFEALEINQLNLPNTRTPKRIKTVEASTRIDSIASAGFGISRGKIVNLIKEEHLRLNWTLIKQPSRTVKKGDRIQLERKGTLEVLDIQPTKKYRWRIELLRK